MRNTSVESYSFKVTPLFPIVKTRKQPLVCGFIIGKKLKKSYLGAIQYERNTDFSKREPHTVSF